MKPPVVLISLLVVGGLLVSCCCPGHAGRHNLARGRTIHPQVVDGVTQEVDFDTEGTRIILQADNPLPVIARDQEGLYSCWAASAEMIMEFIGGVRVRQCAQASRPSDDPSIASACCDESGNLSRHPDCDSPDFPEFGRWGFACQANPPNAPAPHSPAPDAPAPKDVLSWQQVKDEIDAWRPFAFSWGKAVTTASSNSRMSHMMVAIGYNEGGGQQALFCLNPRAFGITDVIMVPYADYSRTATTGTPVVGDVHIHEYDWYWIMLQKNQ